jgi:hypothetical protein
MACSAQLGNLGPSIKDVGYLDGVGKVIIDKYRGEVSLLEQGTIENFS